MNTVLIVIPAAGASSRMRGRDKLLEEISGQPLLARGVGRALATGALVLVTLPPDRPARAAALAGFAGSRLITRVIDDAEEGMAASIRAAARDAEGRDAAKQPGFLGLMVVPADMPELETEDFQKVIACFSSNPDAIARGCGADGTPGHPVIFPRRLFGALAALTGDSGGRALLEGEAIIPVPLPARHALTDLDTPEDWAAWRAGQNG